MAADNVDAVRVAVIKSPQRSVCRRAVSLEHRSSVRRIMLKDLKSHHFKLRVVYDSRTEDNKMPRQFCEQS